MIHIEITNGQSIAPIEPEPIRKLLKSVFDAEGYPDTEVSIALVDNQQIHQINRDFLHHDYPTDVISFRLDDDTDLLMQDPGHSRKPATHTLIGEVVVSVETAAQMAVENNWCIGSEVLLYCLHGSLHLCGYDDLTEPERMKMRERELHYLAPLGLYPLVDQ